MNKNTLINFDKETHTYSDAITGEYIPGVTTILQVRQKPFLLPWAVKVCSEYISGKWEANRGYSEEDISRILLEGKRAYKNIAKDATDVGSIVHSLIEQHICGDALAIPENEEVKKSFQSFLDWESERKPKWLESELVVYSPKHKYAGTMDFLAKIDGKITLGDFKTSKMISEEYFLQLASYQNALEEIGVKVEQRMIVRVPKDGKPVEELIVPTSYERDLECFLALRNASQWNNYVEVIRGNK